MGLVGTGGVVGTAAGDLFMGNFLIHFEDEGGIVYDDIILTDTKCINCGKDFEIGDRPTMQITQKGKKEVTHYPSLKKEIVDIIGMVPVHSEC